jgi:hypothetical protein
MAPRPAARALPELKAGLQSRITTPRPAKLPAVWLLLAAAALLFFETNQMFAGRSARVILEMS